MSFRARLLVTFLLTGLLPVIALTLLIRGEMTGRLTAQYERQIEAMTAVIEEDLAQHGAVIGQALTRLRQALTDDNRFRRAAVDRAPEERRYLLDYAGAAMDLAGLAMLQIQDDQGRILSSGHFRNEYDRLDPALPKLLAARTTSQQATALVQARSPDGPFLTLARVDSFEVGGRRFTLVGGLEVEPRLLMRLARGSELTVSLAYPGGLLTSLEATTLPATEANGAPDLVATGALAREVPVPFIEAGRADSQPARFLVAHPRTELLALRQSIDRWFLIVGLAMGLLAVGAAGWLATRISRPLMELAGQTARLDLDRLHVRFKTYRKDEIGDLARVLNAMTARLRASAAKIKEAERRATIGELARQVNHDIKNGLTPIRNVFRHLAQLASAHPEELPEVFRDRQATLDSSIAYLEALASNYARLSPRRERQPCDVSAIVQHVVRDLQGPGQPILRTTLARQAIVLGDPVALRRIVENLVDNAIDSLDSPDARVTVSTDLVSDDDRPLVRLAVADEGIGMTPEQVANAFDDFYTAKPGGTGLGLSIVRRLVMDLDGAIRVESEPGEGSRFVVELPMGKGRVGESETF